MLYTRAPPALNLGEVQLDVRDGENEAEALQEEEKFEHKSENSDDYSAPDKFEFTVSEEKEVWETAIANGLNGESKKQSEKTYACI